MKNLFLLFTVLLTINFCSTQSDSSNQDSSNPNLSTPDPSKSFDGKYETILTSSQFEIKDGKYLLNQNTNPNESSYIKILTSNTAIFKRVFLNSKTTSFFQIKLEENTLYTSSYFTTEQEATSTTPIFSKFATKIQ